MSTLHHFLFHPVSDSYKTFHSVSTAHSKLISNIYFLNLSTDSSWYDWNLAFPGDIISRVCVCVCVCVCSVTQSYPGLCNNPMDIAHQDPLFMEFSRQEYWTGLLLPSPRSLPNPGIKPEAHVAPALAGKILTTALSNNGTFLSDISYALLPGWGFSLSFLDHSIDNKFPWSQWKQNHSLYF